METFNLVEGGHASRWVGDDRGWDGDDERTTEWSANNVAIVNESGLGGELVMMVVTEKRSLTA